jgi:iron complex outermembrane receptor protein
LTDAGEHTRDSKAVYADFAVKPVEALQIDAAVRYESYSDFGDTTVAKLTGRYDFNDAFALRATASTGFRAPTLAESYYSATNVSPTTAFVQLPPNAPAAALIGINGLDPEKSRNFSIGAVFNPLPGLTATLDIYEIKIEDRIVVSGQLFGTGGAINSPAVRDAILANGNTLDPTVSQTGVRIFSNGLDTRTRGVDLIVNYSSDFGALGDVDWSLAANYTDTKVTRIAPPPAQLAAGVQLFDRTAISDLETAAPKVRVVGAATWTLGDLGVTLKESYFGEAVDYATRTGGIYYENKVSPTVITDLDISYQLTDEVKISVGANNLFNEYPDKQNAALRQDYLSVNNQSYTGQYIQFSPFGINGGFYYGKLQYSF